MNARCLTKPPKFAKIRHQDSFLIFGIYEVAHWASRICGVPIALPHAEEAVRPGDSGMSEAIGG